MAEQGSLQGPSAQRKVHVGFFHSITQGGPGSESRTEATNNKVKVQALHQ